MNFSPAHRSLTRSRNGTRIWDLGFEALSDIDGPPSMVAYAQRPEMAATHPERANVPDHNVLTSCVGLGHH